MPRLDDASHVRISTLSQLYASPHTIVIAINTRYLPIYLPPRTCVAPPRETQREYAHNHKETAELTYAMKNKSPEKKRARVDQEEVDDDLPLVEPRGNGLLLPADSPGLIDVGAGIGDLMKAIGGPEVLNDKLFPYLDVKDLCRLSTCSKALWTLTHADVSLWRELALNELPDHVLDERLNKGFNHWKSVATGFPHTQHRFGRMFSDALHRPIQCAHAKIDPSWLSRDNVTRESRRISVEEFVEKYENPRIPVVLTGFESDFSKGIKRWKDGIQKGMNSLKNKEGRLRSGPRTINCRSIANYSVGMLAASDESPLYVFDSKFAETFPELGEDYSVPEIVRGSSRDLFELLGPERRPDYRWIIAGAAKSGSKWHVDPNCTHAWNVSMWGRKKWVMLPPWGTPPPGVFPSADGGSVAQPVSLIEWFLEFYKTTRKTRDDQFIEFVADVGEFVFVPSGWWHAVLNVDESFAVTQNYVAKSNLPRAMRFFEQKPDQISGLNKCSEEEDRRKTFAQEFQGVLPQKLQELCMVSDPEGALENRPLVNASWSYLVPKKDNVLPEAASTFSFGFQIEPEEDQ